MTFTAAVKKMNKKCVCLRRASWGKHTVIIISPGGYLQDIYNGNNLGNPCLNINEITAKDWEVLTLKKGNI